MTNAIITTQEASTPATISDYVNQYRHYAKKTVESVILLGKTICDAEKFLKKAEFDEFCVQIGSGPKDSTFRKLREIGKMDYRFNEHLDILPNSWTTLYQLAKLEDNQFSNLIEKNVLHKDVTSKEIKEVLDVKKEKEKANKVTLKLEYVATNSASMFQMEQEMDKIAKRYGIQVKIENNDLYKQWKEIEEAIDIAA